MKNNYKKTDLSNDIKRINVAFLKCHVLTTWTNNSSINITEKFTFSNIVEIRKNN